MGSDTNLRCPGTYLVPRNLTKPSLIHIGDAPLPPQQLSSHSFYFVKKQMLRTPLGSPDGENGSILRWQGGRGWGPT
jgi:hypothetical protein